MKTYDPRLIAFTASHEGFVSRWYRDATGTATIGYGFTWKSRIFRSWWLKKHGRRMRSGDVIVKDDAERILKRLIDEEYAPVVFKKAVGSNLSPHALAGAIDMTYNAGPRALKWKWFQALLKGYLSLATKHYRQTAVTSKGRRLAGLLRRRREGAHIIEHNMWPLRIETKRTDWLLDKSDQALAIEWLVALGFFPKTYKTKQRDEVLHNAVLSFQRQHKQLENDGVLGRASFTQIQRVMDMRKKAAQVTAAGSLAVVAGGGTELVTGLEPTGFAEWFLLGGIFILCLGLAYLIWRYRDEIPLFLKSLKGMFR